MKKIRERLANRGVEAARLYHSAEVIPTIRPRRASKIFIDLDGRVIQCARKRL